MDISNCMTAEKMRITSIDDVHLGILSELKFHG